MAWNKTKESPKKQSAQKPGAASVQQARRQRLKKNFLFLMESF